MEHLLLKAATTATDKGIFEAVISTASIDRDGDIVEPTAIVKALGKWAALGKLMPLAYSHRDPATGQAVVVGHIEPPSARVEGQEVITKGWVDQSTERGAETWRLVKSGTLGFSYGYLVPEGGATKRTGKKKGYHITEIDLYEVSVVPVGPSNNDTRVLSFKSAEELREDSTRHERELLDATLPEVTARTPDPGPSLEDVQRELVAVKAALATAEQKLAVPKDSEELRKDSERLEREVAESKIPKIPSSDSGPRVDLEKELQEVKAQLVETTASLEDLKRRGEQDPERLRKESDRRAREVAEAKLPDDIPDRPAVPEPDLVKEFHEVKAQLAEMAAGFEIMKKKAEEADKEPDTVRSVDPLRKRSEELALEIASGGMSLRKPPTEVKEPSEPVDVEALRRKSRDHMFEVLSYSTE